MFPEDKIIEIFSICDDFSKVFDKTVDQNAITACDAGSTGKCKISDLFEELSLWV